MTPNELKAHHVKCVYLAKQQSLQSADPSTKIGAVVVHKVLGDILGYGYNRFPGNVQQTAERLNDRPTKYMFMAHAEEVAIFDGLTRAGYSSGRAIKLSDYAIYVYGVPICMSCMKTISLAGIKTAYYYNAADDVTLERWENSDAQKLALEDGISLTCLNSANFDEALQSYEHSPKEFRL